MSYEDVIRVAQAKIAPARMRRIGARNAVKDQPYAVTEFLKPGIEELCQVLPPIGRGIVRFERARLARPGLFRHGGERPRSGAICASGR